MVRAKFKLWLSIFLLVTCFMNSKENDRKEFYYRGALYQDWLGLKSPDTDLYNRLSTRLKLTLWNKPGNGWTIQVDLRNRNTLGDRGRNQFILYDATLSFNTYNSKLFFSLGQMNLYDSAGIGSLTGGIVGYKMNRFISIGGYAGLEPDIYNSKWNTNHNKFGLFFRYTGRGARQFSLSFNRINYDGNLERQFVYSSMLLPLRRVVVFYGNVEYELDSKIRQEDRLSRLFLNARFDLSKYLDITANYSSGRGLDYHRFVLEQSQDPTVSNAEIERYYYNEVAGVRLSIKPYRWIRIYAALRKSRHKDDEVENNSTRLGLSLNNILKSGISLLANYNINRGDSSESDSYYFSLARNFGNFSLNMSFANVYNGLRLAGTVSPELIHLPDQKTFSTDVFFSVNRSLALSASFVLTRQEEYNDSQFFIRLILRK